MNMENSDHFKSKMNMEAVKEAHLQQLLITTKTLKNEKEQLKKLYDTFSTTCDNLTHEMAEYTELVEGVLQSAPAEEISKTNLMESLQACFVNPSDELMQLMTKIKQQHLLETQQVYFTYTCYSMQCIILSLI